MIVSVPLPIVPLVKSVPELIVVFAQPLLPATKTKPKGVISTTMFLAVLLLVMFPKLPAVAIGMKPMATPGPEPATLRSASSTRPLRFIPGFVPGAWLSIWLFPEYWLKARVVAELTVVGAEVVSVTPAEPPKAIVPVKVG